MRRMRGCDASRGSPAARTPYWRPPPPRYGYATSRPRLLRLRRKAAALAPRMWGETIKRACGGAGFREVGRKGEGEEGLEDWPDRIRWRFREGWAVGEGS